jgi:hypothetical protein
MTEQTPSSENLNAIEANLAMRKAHREATAHAGHLADRLAEVDIHQREARYLLERAGLLLRRRRT